MRDVGGQVMLERRERRRLTDDEDGNITLEFHVVHSPAYAAPVLYYNAYRQ